MIEILTWIGALISTLAIGFAWGLVVGNYKGYDAGYDSGDLDGWQRGVRDARQIYREETARMAAEKCK